MGKANASPACAATDRGKARSLASRAAILALGGVTERELDRLRGIISLADSERPMVASWGDTSDPAH